MNTYCGYVILPQPDKKLVAAYAAAKQAYQFNPNSYTYEVMSACASVLAAIKRRD